MIGRIYRLMDTKRIERIQREVKFRSGDVLVQPDYLSICAADQRYYFGRRDREILNRKLPMALIHEATATVMYDYDNRLPHGSKVVLIPLIVNETERRIKANYNAHNRFMSSDTDGFMRDILSLPASSVVPIQSEYSVVFAFSELVSVAINALDTFERVRLSDADTFGIWGDGNLGYIVALTIRHFYPHAKIYVFGKNPRKLQHFSFADGTCFSDSLPAGLELSHCFECVGGKNSGAVLAQMVKMISPQGCINLLGVSDDPIPASTRTILEKGLILTGNSRSNSEDMWKAVALIQENSVYRKYLGMLISDILTVKNENDMIHAFEQSSLNDFKTVMKWEV